MQDLHESSSRYQALKARFTERCQQPIPTTAQKSISLNLSSDERHAPSSISIVAIADINHPNLNPNRDNVIPDDNGAVKSLPIFNFDKLHAVAWLVLAPVFLLICLTMLFRFSRRRRSQFLGQQGERRVALLLKKALKGEEFRLYYNLILSLRDAKTDSNSLTEIDLLLLTHFGVFVIEVKNYAGWIFGQEKQPRWTQKLFARHSQFQNPLHQNYKHCLAVENYLELETSAALISLVVFADRASFKTPMPENVIHESELMTYIESARIASKIDSCFTSVNFEHLALRLDEAALFSTQAAKELHLTQLKHRRYEPSISELAD
ncbi:NERD domain-containing protein [Shewanella sp. A25]|nr:NERD domain-containing protein [Shewanella shenzhenensis]